LAAIILAANVGNVENVLFIQLIQIYLDLAVGIVICMCCVLYLSEVTEPQACSLREDGAVPVAVEGQLRLRRDQKLAVQGRLSLRYSSVHSVASC